MRVASLAVGVIGLVLTLIGTAGFVPFIRSTSDSVVGTLVGWILIVWVKVFRPPWRAVLALLLFMALVLKLKEAGRAVHHIGATGKVTTSGSASARVIRAALPEAEWRDSVDARLLDLSEQLREAKTELAAAEERLATLAVQEVKALRTEREQAERRAVRLVFVGVLCQVVSAVLALLAHTH